MFRRRRRTDEDPIDDEPLDAPIDDDAVDDDAGADDDDVDDDAAEPAPLSDRPDGPWDATEVDLADGVQRLDLGSLVITGRDGLELQVQMDEQSGQVVAITAVVGDGAVQLQAFAAPRTSGIWPEVRHEIQSSINQQGGLVEEADGPFGTELRTKVPAQAPDGSNVLQSARFVGVDGPRWFLRGVFLGSGADPTSAAPVEDVFRGVVVVRGGEAMAPGDPLPVTLPMAAEEDEAPDGGRPALNPFERGPEITEIR